MLRSARAVRAPKGPGWWASAPGAEAVVLAQVLIGIALWLALPSRSDDYGLSGGSVLGVILLPFLALFGGVVLVGIAFLHPLVLARPALALARRTGREAAAPAWLFGASALCALLPWRYGAPYPASWAWIAASGVLPLLVARRALRTGRGCGSVVKRTGLAAGALALVILAGGAVLAGAGVLGYEPPRLERARYVGQWGEKEGGGVVRLREDGGAVVERVPLGDSPDAVAFCSGVGTWEERPAGRPGGLRAGVDVHVAGCAGWFEGWEVSGTAEHPELFHVAGDPDQGDVRLLRRTGS